MIRFDSILTGGTVVSRIVAAAGAGGVFQVLPGLAAAFGAKSFSQPMDSGERSAGESKTRINESDIAHMNAFPAANKAWVLDQIMSLTPVSTEVRSKRNDYEKLLLRLRDDGFALVDLQPHETAFTSVWYRNGRTNGARENVAMLLWETLEVGDSTTVMMWRI